MARSGSIPRLRIRSLHPGGLISGTSQPHARIEAINLSRIAGQRLCIGEAVIIGVADHRGRFSGRLACSGGDLIRLRANAPRGKAGPWLNVRLPSAGRRRRPDVALYRIGFRRCDEDCFGLLNIGRPRPISEPGAVLLFRNLRTSLATRITLNGHGSFERQHRLAARPGDEFSVRLAQAANTPLGTVTIPRAPTPARHHISASRLAAGYRDMLIDKAALRGRVFVGEPCEHDVVQGELADCHLAGAASAVAHTCRGRIRRMIRRVDRTHYAVSLFEYDRAAGRFRPVSIVVDNQFYVRPCGKPLFGAGAVAAAAPADHEAALWWPLLEKAYAELHGGYRSFRFGGTAHYALALLLGRPPRHRDITPSAHEALWNGMVGALSAGLPVVASTADTSSSLRYRHTLIQPNHCYAVRRCWTLDDGSRVVSLRNPWGEITPPQAEDAHRGCFTMPWDTMARLFSLLSTVAP
jgi:hypothetical protein